MTARAGEAFETGRAVSDVEALLVAPVPTAGPTPDATEVEGDPSTGEWTATSGAGFRIVPLWESGDLVGVYGPGWDEAEEAAEEHLACLVAELDRRWGAHRRVSMRVPLFRKQAGAPMPALFQALCDADCFGDLTVWGPLSAGRRWIAVSVNQSDGDAPMIMTAAVSDRPVTELDDQSVT
ncbi:hypothetical protein ACFWAA_13095 [Streptomyces sp. NPDC059922]|uniref:hypothetical protein n=1 Tax=Streptomyces sp. NPDC059922 TaxID=3347005 RepID=UPI00365393E7